MPENENVHYRGALCFFLLLASGLVSYVISPLALVAVSFLRNASRVDSAALNDVLELYEQAEEIANSIRGVLRSVTARDHLMQMTDIFKALDHDGDGNISSQEFRQGLVSMGVR